MHVYINICIYIDIFIYIYIYIYVYVTNKYKYICIYKDVTFFVSDSGEKLFWDRYLRYLGTGIWTYSASARCASPSRARLQIRSEV